MTAEDRGILAGELALGLLDGEERGEALRLMLADRDFARAVEAWRDHFAALFAECAPVAPDAALETRIVAALPGSGVSADGTTVPGIGSRAVRLWRTVAGAAMLAAAALLAVILLRPERVSAPRPTAPLATPAPLVAMLTPTDDAKPLAALVDRATGVVTLAGTIDLPAGRVAELWTIGADGVPRSLGVLANGAARLPVAPTRRGRLTPSVVLAVSIEPPGGSPTGAPTGPVIATGPMSAA
ncbi:MAG TPA: anti-sigma factor [Sphingomonas sp.]|jgi:anti-sigma-K factor RskA|uniref:anti-sigma factor n=1 Tax=Sphingomonas sp. TaxID=28214 RepID=UPI002ED7DA7B